MTENLHGRQDLTSYETKELKEVQKNPDYVLSSQMENRFVTLGYIERNDGGPCVTELGSIAIEIAT